MSIIHTDAFTVGTDTNLGAYGNWEVTLGAAGDLRVEESTDRVEIVTLNADKLYRWNGASSPTSGRITADLRPTGNGVAVAGEGSVGLIARADANGNAYLAFWSAFEGDIILYRITGNGTAFTEVNRSAGQIVNGGTTYVNAYFEVTGTGAAVSLSAGDDTNGADAVTYSDTDASRLTTGLFGVHMYGTDAAFANGGASPAWIDNLDIDDLVAAGGGQPTVKRLAGVPFASSLNPTGFGPQVW